MADAVEVVVGVVVTFMDELGVGLFFSTPSPFMCAYQIKSDHVIFHHVVISILADVQS